MAASIERACWCGCSLAHSMGTFELDGGATFPLVACDRCGVQAIFPQPGDDVLHSYYAPEYYGASREKFIWPFASVIRWFQSSRARRTRRIVAPPARLLDIGCGNGEFLIQMRRWGYQCEGTEWTAQSAARVPACEHIPMHVGDLLNLDLPQRAYDMVTMWHVLEHVRKPDEALRKIKRLLKPDGQLMLALPNVESAQARRFGLSWLHYDPPRHLCNFGVRSLKTLLEVTGYDIQWITARSLEQDTFGYMQSWLNRRGYPRDRLYAALKGLGWRTNRDKWIDGCWFAALAGPALIGSIFDAARGQGGTIVLGAKSRD